MTDTETVRVDLAGMLRAGAEGSYPAEAAVELLVRHRVWLRRRDFTDHIVTNSTEQKPLTRAWINWSAVPTNLVASGSERRILNIARSLRTGTQINLAETLSSLDQYNLRLVLCAAAHAVGGAEAAADHLGGWPE